MSEGRRGHVVCAPNAFKGTLTAAAAATAMATGIRRACPGAEVVELPVADGGDGTLDVLLAAAGAIGRVETLTVSGPLGEPVAARLGWIAADTAVVELAEASGLRLLGHTPTPVDASAASSRGTGELLRGALDRGARRVIVGVGGSACSDGGAGLLAALGVRLLDADNRPLADGGGNLEALAAVDASTLDPRLAHVSIEVAVDTEATLLGDHGVAPLYAPQKGADGATVAALARGLTHLAALAGPALGATADLAHRPRTGAAGGCSWALAALGAQLRGGAALVCDAVGLDDALRGASLVLTGEGQLDATTATGKAPFEVLERARRAGVPCVAIIGRRGPGAPGGWRDVIALSDLAAATGGDPITDAAALVETAAAQAARGLPAA